MFNAISQDQLPSRIGFEGAKNIIKEKQNVELYDRFAKFIWAINVLKHFGGISYYTLVSKFELLPFGRKLQEENYFGEGDVSAIDIVIEVNDNFVLNCANLIEKVSNKIRN